MTPKELKNIIEKHFDLSISTKNRSAKYVLARAYYFKTAYDFIHPAYSLKKIGAEINRDHATVLHHIKRLLRRDEQLKYNKFLIKHGFQINSINTSEEDYYKRRIAELEKKVSQLEKSKILAKSLPSGLIEKLSKLQEDAAEAVIDRFLLIADMELKKKY